MHNDGNGPAVDRMRRQLAGLRLQAQFRTLQQKPGINLCSNDYLGLADDSRLREAVSQCVQSLRLASTGSRLLSGNAPIWEEVEEEFSAFAGAGSALYFSSGYAANVGLLSSVILEEDLVFSDVSNHASLIDGLRLSKARKIIFPHLDLDFLQDSLRIHQDHPGQKFIVLESIFSMDGDRAPLREVLELAERYGAEVIVDEAHAIGVFGPEGRGVLAELNLTHRALATVYPCGKALASMGAFVCGGKILKDYLVNHARTFIFSTAMPPYMAAQIREAVRIARRADAERRQLEDRSGWLRSYLQKHDFNTGHSNSQIVPVILGSNEAALEMAAQLSRSGFAVSAIRPPTVPVGGARLRISLTAGIGQPQVQRLAEEMVAARSHCLDLAR